MNRAVQKRHHLSRFARQLSKRHDEDCNCFDELFELDECVCDKKTPVIEMDVRERKWAAQKLLRPIEDNAGYEDFTIEDWLEVARQSWQLRLESYSPPLNTLERFQFSARQLQYTVAYARAVWGLTGSEEVADEGEVTNEDDDFDIGWLEGDMDDDAEGNDTSDLFDWDASDIEVNYSSDPETEAPYQTSRDVFDNKVKLY